MLKAMHAFLALIATSTDRALARQLEYVLAENRMLRERLPKRILLKPAERSKLAKLAAPLGKAIRHLATIVSPGTVLRWIREEQGAAKKPGTKRNKPGRPKTQEEIRALVVRLAMENSWGYTRILGEITKLGLRKVISRQTVKNILKEHGIDPGPKRGEDSWTRFLSRHGKSLYACDFFSKKLWTLRGMVDCYFLVFMQIETRRIFITPSTVNPTWEWTEQQARNFLMWTGDEPIEKGLMLRDNDKKYPPAFDKILEESGVKVHRNTPMSPNLNAYVERLGQRLKHECLSFYIAFSTEHLDYLNSQWAAYYHTERPHQAKDNLLLSVAESSEEPPDEPIPSPDDIICFERLDGLLKHYERKKAA